MKRRLLSLIAATLIITSVLLCFISCGLFSGNDEEKSNDIIFDISEPEVVPVISFDGYLFLNEDEKNCDNIYDKTAMLLMRYTDNTVYNTSGYVEMYDKLAYCYLVHDENGNFFFTENMDSANPLYLQLGLQHLTGLEEIISREMLYTLYIDDYIYSTSANKTVADGDVISLTYCSINAGESMGTIVFQEYYVVDAENDELSRHLIGAREGQYLPYMIHVETEEEGETVIKEYASVKVEHIVKDKRVDRVKAGDYIITSYDLSFDATQFYNAASGSYDLPACFPAEYGYEIVDGQCVVEVKNDLAQVNSTEVYGGIINPTAYMINFEPGDTPHTITASNSLLGNFTLSNVKVHSIVTSTENDPYTLTDILYPSDKYQEPVIVKNTYGKEIDIRDTSLTLCIFPVGYLEAEEFSVENIFINFYNSATMTESGSSPDAPVYAFSSLNHTSFICTLENDDAGKTAAQIAEELKTLCSEYNKLVNRLNGALSNLKTAQSNYANLFDGLDSDEHTLLQKLEEAENNYMNAFTEKETAYLNILTKIASFEACETNDGGTISDFFIENCRKLIHEGGTVFIYGTPTVVSPNIS